MIIEKTSQFFSKKNIHVCRNIQVQRDLVFSLLFTSVELWSIEKPDNAMIDMKFMAVLIFQQLFCLLFLSALSEVSKNRISTHNFSTAK